MRIAVVATNDPRNYSGGRYHGLMIAYAAAAAGMEVHVCTDRAPAFINDLAPLCASPPMIHETRDFRSGMPAGVFDYVIVIPTGIFLPEFYEAALDFARGRQARIGLVNFESANWFNRDAPVPRDPRAWEYWQRICQGGALVLSSARTSDAMARRFYRSSRSSLRFEVWSPAVNTIAARQADGLDKDGSLVAFVRPSDAHKGAGGLLSLDRTLLRGRKLVLIAGTALDAAFQDSIRAMVDAIPGASVQHVSRIPDVTKFRLLTAASALLFPSQFEGYGYPPVEAAFAGTEIVCNDLPVLRETVGSIAHFAPLHDKAGFNAALAAALAMPPRRAALRAAVFRRADFGFAAKQLAEVLYRSAEAVQPLAPQSYRSAWGPWAKTPLRTISPGEEMAPRAPLMPEVLTALRRGDELFVSVRMSTRQPTRSVKVIFGETAAPAATLPGGQAVDGWSPNTIHFVAPAGQLGQIGQIELAVPGDDGPTLAEFRLDAAEDIGRKRQVMFGISEDKRERGVRRLRGYMLSDPATTSLLISTGRENGFFEVALSQERRDLAQKFTDYPSHRCQFIVDLPEDIILGRDTLCFGLAGAGLTDIVLGWPPRPRDAIEAAADPDKAPDHTATAAARQVFNIDPSTNDYWLNGVGRTSAIDRQGVVALVLGGQGTPLPAVGDFLRVASGRILRIVAIEPKNRTVNVYVARPLNHFTEGAPSTAELIAAVADTPAGVDWLEIIPRSDDFWFNGVWGVRDKRHHRGVLVHSSDATARLSVGASVEMRSAGQRIVTGIEAVGAETRIWLDSPVGPLLDGAPNTMRVLAILNGGDVTSFDLSPDALGEAAGGRGFVLRQLTGSETVIRGSVLRFPASGVRRVLAVQLAESRLHVTLDLSLRPEDAGVVILIRGAEIADGVSSTALFGVPPFAARDAGFLRFALDALHDGRAVLPASEPQRWGRERIMFVTPVPPMPTNQGNRAVTRNIIQHLVDLGFDVDVVLQGPGDVFEAVEVFGDRVRILQTGFPNWAAAKGPILRAELQQRLAASASTGVEQMALEHVSRAIRTYHPFFIVRDETVELARSLFVSNRYSAIVCNYTHMVRVAKELEASGPLPPVAVITHDMLSRLPVGFGGKAIDTLYRYCPPTLEREVLDMVEGAVVVAISESERAYLDEIGLVNRVVLAEYAGIEEVGRRFVSAEMFDRCIMVYHASSNPMNVAGLNWFIDECWPDIVRQVPQVHLIIAGRITEAWKHQLPGITLAGEIERAELIELLLQSTIAINPCVVGTGLKIKTVEAACLGLPTVCLPDAVDGLEAVAADLGIVAATAAEFTGACARLLSDREAWMGLARTARALALKRFHATAVYRELDGAMGWSKNADQRRMTPPDRRPADSLLGPGSEPSPVGGGDFLSRLTDDPSDTDAALILGYKLAMIGQQDIGLNMIEDATRQRPGDPHAAAMASITARRCGHGWLAATHAAVVVAQRPTEAVGYLLMAQGWRDCNRMVLAEEAMMQAFAVAPFDADVRKTFAEIFGSRHEPQLARLIDRRVMVKRGDPLPFTFDHVGYDELGVGWSRPEDWGTWTDGPAAWLHVELSEALPSLRIEMAVLGRRRADGAGQRFALLVDGDRAGEWTLEGDGSVRTISTVWTPRMRKPTSQIELTLLIADPVPLSVDGLLEDPRRLGLAMLWLTIDEQATLVYAEPLQELDGREFVTQCYQQILGKMVDPDGMAYYLSELARGVSKVDIMRHLVTEEDALAAGVRLMEVESVG